MKKLIFLCVVMLASVCAFAQDVIIKRDASKIQAKIIEVSDSEVRYKNFNNQSGPTFVVKTDDIATIMYENGEVQLFEKKAEPAVQSGRSSYDSPYGGELSYMGGNYFLNDKIMSKDEYRYFLQKNCKPAYEYYRKCTNMGNWGIGLTSAGAALLIVGGVLFAEEEDVAGPIMLGVGFACTVTGVPLLSVGYTFRKKSTLIYNERCSNSACNNVEKIRFELQTSRDGLGIALRF